MIALENADKNFHKESISGPSSRGLLPWHPYRICLASPPNCGKTSCMMNLCAREDPPFERIIVMHASDTTAEYDILEDFEMYAGEVPPISEFDGKQKTLLIIDDFPFVSLSKEKKMVLDRIFGFCSTHMNTSIMVACQDMFTIPPNIRRCCSFYCLWRSPDKASMRTISARIGHPIERILDETNCSFHDFICVDMTGRYPHLLLRKNFFEPILIDEDVS